MMGVVEAIGYVAAVLVFLTFYMKTMIPLRITGICSNFAFITYGFFGGVYPILILHCILLPLNGVRLRQMLRLTRQVREATRADLSMEWLKPFTTTRRAQAGEVLFRKGDVAADMFVVVSGRFRLMESGIDLAPPAVVGELALLAPERTRTQTLQCVEAGKLLQIGYSQVEQLFFQNPQFGFYFVKLIAGRMFANVGRLEAELARYRGAQTA